MYLNTFESSFQVTIDEFTCVCGVNKTLLASLLSSPEGFFWRVDLLSDIDPYQQITAYLLLTGSH